MDPKLKALVDAPLADPLRLNIPGGRDALPPKPREKREHLSPTEKKERGYLTGKQLAQRKHDEAYKKLSTLFDYYSTTDIPAERVAEHCGVYRLVEVGSEDGKPVYERQLDVERVRQELDFRRKGLRAGE
jgi:hypothetical protein